MTDYEVLQPSERRGATEKKFSAPVLPTGVVHLSQFSFPCLSAIISALTRCELNLKNSDKFSSEDLTSENVYTHEYWLDSFLPMSGQLIFWRSILMMQIKRIKFTCGENEDIMKGH